MREAWLEEGLIVDNFAGGGGASTGIEMALGRSPDVAINHDAEAVSMHAANHPATLHLCQNVWKADPREVVRQASAKRCADLGIATRDLPVRLAWFSPDCKHFSKAKGSKPVEKGIRDLAWVVVHWARLVRPDVIMLENVEEFRQWGPLVATDDGKLVPCPLSKGFTFKRWVRALRKLGYTRIEWRELRAYRYRTPTIRKRLYVIARRDGLPIVWPEPTHEKDGAGGCAPWLTAADCIDWATPCPSIFTRLRPLAENTLRRIARGVMRYVVNAERPFIVSTAHGGTTGRAPYVWSADEPLRTEKASQEYGVVQPFVVGIDNKSNGDRDAWPGAEPLRTMTVENRFALVTPLTHQGGDRGQPVDEPLCTVTGAHRGEQAIVEARAVVPHLSAYYGEGNGGTDRTAPITEPTRVVTTENRHALVAAHITKFRTGSDGHAADEPMHTITANSFKKRPGGAAPIGLVSACLTPRYGERPGQAPRARSVEEPMPAVVPTQNGAQLVASFLAQHNTGNDGHPAEVPLSTIVGKGCTQGVVAAHMLNLKGSERRDGPAAAPAWSITAGGQHVAAVEAFLIKYYGQGTGQSVDEPAHVVTTKERFGLVTTLGEPYQIVDIGMRMLQPRELYRAQGFPESYIIDRGADGKPLTKTAQVRMVGNSVCPPVAEALVRANLLGAAQVEERAAD